MIVHRDDAHTKSCPFNEFNPCLGEGCMAWGSYGRDYETRETDNLEEVDGSLRPNNEIAPCMPEGEGWEKDGPEMAKGYHRSAKDNLPKGRSQRWIRRIDQARGVCGKIGGHW